MKRLLFSLVCLAIAVGSFAQSPLSESSLTSGKKYQSSLFSSSPTASSPVVLSSGSFGTSYGNSSMPAVRSMSRYSSQVTTPFVQRMPPTLLRDDNNDDDWEKDHGGGGGNNTGDVEKDQFAPLGGEHLLLLAAILYMIGLALKQLLRRNSRELRYKKDLA